MSKTEMLSGMSVLIVEDEYLTAYSLLMELEDAGAKVVGPVSDVAAALDLLERDIALDGAVLDINLRGTMGFAVAEKLRDIRVPFVFVTGYECSAMPEGFKSFPCLVKPCNEHRLLEMLAAFRVQARHRDATLSE